MIAMPDINARITCALTRCIDSVESPVEGVQVVQRMFMLQRSSESHEGVCL